MDALKEVTLRIPENKFDFFMELIKNLGLEVTENIEIPEAHKAIVRERMNKSLESPERLLDWDQAEKYLRPE